MPISPDKYEQVKKENIQLKENNELLLEENSVHRDLLMVTTFPLLVCISLLYGSMHHYVTAYNCRLCFKKWEKSHLLKCYNVLQILMHVVIRFCIMKNYFDNLSIVLGGWLSR